MNERSAAEQVAGHNARNESLLAHLRKLGAQLDSPRAIDCYFWAPTVDVANRLRHLLAERSLGDATTSPPAEGNAVWSVQVQLSIRPDMMGSADMTEQLVQLAIDCGAEYDGWGTRVDEARGQQG